MSRAHTNYTKILKISSVLHKIHLNSTLLLEIEISLKLWTGQHINHNSCPCCALSHTGSWKRQATQSSEIQEEELIK